MNPDNNTPAVPQFPEAEQIRENSMLEPSSEVLAREKLDFTLKTEPEAFINEESEDCKMLHMCEEPGCSFITRWDFAFNHHAKTHHQKKSSSSRISGFDCRKKLENLLCHSWDYESAFKVNFDSHLRSHYDWTSQKILRAPKDEELLENGGRCEKCGFESVSNFLVQVHNFRNSPPQPSILLPNYNVSETRDCKNEQGLYQCNFCDFTTKSRSSFIVHRKNVELHQKKVKWIICPFCDFKHKRRYKMRSHVYTLHKSGIIRRPFKLPRKFGCANCTFRATRRSYLAKHILTCQISKDDVKYHNCSECTYKTKRKHRLRRHVLVKHTPEEALQMVECDRCSYKAKCFDNLKKHLVSIHGSQEDIKWFHCDHCQFKTKSKSYLNKHIKRKHLDPKCLKCDLCKYNTKNKRKFKKHLAEEHGSVVVKNEVHEDIVC